MRNSVQLSHEDFKRLQMLELDNLKEFDRVCRKHRIIYTLSSGTMLGAVRHKGFIPWDDDADISMLREEYEKFVLVSNELDQNICFFQDHSTDPEYRWGYGKIRRTGTQYIRTGQEHLKCQTGIFIDIFPLDDVPNSKIRRIIQKERCFITRKLMYAEIGRVSDNENKFMRLLYSVLSKIPIDYAFYRLKKYTRKSKNATSCAVRTLTYDALGKKAKKLPKDFQYGRPKKWFLNVAEYEFEGCHFYGPKDYDEYLTFKYGDYMKMPPEDKRQQNSPVSYIEFDSEYMVNRKRIDDIQ